jgi:DNA repair photolyase
MNRKPVLYRNAKTALTFDAEEFQEKLLCDGITFNPGDACAYSCEFCYVKSAMWKIDKAVVDAHNKAHRQNHDFHEVVIRRRNVEELLRTQLLRYGRTHEPDPTDNRVVFGSTLVDVAANVDLLRETAAACNLIFEHTHWQVRLLTKSNLLPRLVEDLLVPAKWHQRLILGVSTGTLDDKVAAAIETGTPMVSKRIDSLSWLQDQGIRTFGMICPSLPQEDYGKFSRNMCAAIRADQCEHVWAEVINMRGKTLARTTAGLRQHGLAAEADAMVEVCESEEKWEQYARATFTAHTQRVPPGKLRFLQYITKESAAWWADQRANGAVLLGKTAKTNGLTALHSHVSMPTSLSDDDRGYLRAREGIVTQGVRASITAARALFEIRTYKGGLLWRQEFKSFEAYCRAKWDYSKAHAYRLSDCGDFVIELEAQSPNGDQQPVSEGQVRPLLDLPREARVSAWKACMAEATPDGLTGRRVAALVHAHAEANKIQLKTGARKSVSKAKMVAAALARLRAAMQGHKQERQLGLLLDRVESMLG